MAKQIITTDAAPSSRTDPAARIDSVATNDDKGCPVIAVAATA